MSEIRDKVEEKLYDIIEDRVMTKTLHTGQQIDKLKAEILSISGLTIVDKEAELPSPGIDLDKRLVTLSGTYGAYRLAQQDMTEKGWVKEV